MTWDATAIATAVAVVGVPLTIWGLTIQARTAKHADAKERDDMRQANYDKGVADGKAVMQPSIDLIAYQLAEAVRDRSEAEQRARDLGQRVRDLEKELRFKGGKS